MRYTSQYMEGAHIFLEKRLFSTMLLKSSQCFFLGGVQRWRWLGLLTMFFSPSFFSHPLENHFCHSNFQSCHLSIGILTLIIILLISIFFLDPYVKFVFVFNFILQSQFVMNCFFLVCSLFFLFLDFFVQFLFIFNFIPQSRFMIY